MLTLPSGPQGKPPVLPRGGRTHSLLAAAHKAQTAAFPIAAPYLSDQRNLGTYQVSSFVSSIVITIVQCVSVELRPAQVSSVNQVPAYGFYAGAFSMPADADVMYHTCHQLFACIPHDLACVQLAICKLVASAKIAVRALTSSHKRGGILLEAWRLGIGCSNA